MTPLRGVVGPPSRDADAFETEEAQHKKHRCGLFQAPCRSWRGIRRRTVVVSCIVVPLLTLNPSVPPREGS